MIVATPAGGRPRSCWTLVAVFVPSPVLGAVGDEAVGGLQTLAGHAVADDQGAWAIAACCRSARSRRSGSRWLAVAGRGGPRS